MTAGNLLDVTSHMASVWKADLTSPKLVLSADVRDITAMLTGRSGVRLGQDMIWRADGAEDKVNCLPPGFLVQGSF